jgi:hypothetical protein
MRVSGKTQNRRPRTRTRIERALCLQGVAQGRSAGADDRHGPCNSYVRIEISRVKFEKEIVKLKPRTRVRFEQLPVESE